MLDGEIYMDVLNLVLVWIKLNSHFLSNLNHSKTVPETLRQFSALKFEMICREEVKFSLKGKHVHFDNLGQFKSKRITFTENLEQNILGIY